ncbi:hypothetical protein [Bradyrhizobium sp.]|uniref:hypothetical protein n=1 Tax=Bradyrhizobium sp. TaxID=376 RepID=UPI003C763FB6
MSRQGNCRLGVLPEELFSTAIDGEDHHDRAGSRCPLPAGLGDKRTVMDFRRSGAVEATAGQVGPAALAGKMANAIDTNRDLQATYQPNHKAVVRLADEARARGRTLMREANASGPKK